jgi:hypothetical protein
MNRMEPLDLGGGHRFEFTENQAGEMAGGIHYHPRPDGSGECAGAVTFRGKHNPPPPSWLVVSLEPLTLSPSLLCRSCGSHGYIKNGKWEPC